MESNTKDRELLLIRTLDFPIELVWEVWTKPEHLANWWGPSGFTNTVYTMDMTPGGQFHLTMHGPDGTDYVNKSTYKEVIEHKRISYEHFNPGFVATIDFEAQGDKTQITWHMLFETEELLKILIKAHKVSDGLRQNIEKLSMYLHNQINK